MKDCQACGRPLPSDAYSYRRRYCPGSSACRVKAFRARQEVRRDLAFDLLLRQTRAVQESDTAALAAIVAEVERLLGKSS